MSLIYEVTFPVGVIIAGLAAHWQGTWRSKSKAFLWFLSPLVLSAAINVADYYHWQRPIGISGKSGAVLPVLGKAYFYLMVQPFFPELNSPQAGARTCVPIAKTDANHVLFSVFGLMVAFAVFSIYSAKDRDWRRRAVPWVVTMALVALAHGLLIVTRLVMHEMGIGLLWISSYYCHFFVIYVLVGCAVLTSSQLAIASVWRRFCTVCVSVSLLAIALNAALITHGLCVATAGLSRPIIKCSGEIDAFIERQVAEGATPKMCCIKASGKNLGLGTLNSVLDLYPKYHALTEDGATHLVSCRDDCIEVVPRKSK